MARYRKIPVTKVSRWFDGDLEAAGLWVLLMSDERCGPCGCFMVSRAGLAAEVGLTERQLSRIASDASSHILVWGRWVALRKFQKHQGSGPKWEEAITRDAKDKKVPAEVLAFASGDADTLYHTLSDAPSGTPSPRARDEQEQEQEQKQEQDRSPSEPSSTSVDPAEVFQAYLDICPKAGSFTKHHELNGTMKKQIMARIKERRKAKDPEFKPRSDDIRWWKAYFGFAAASNFLAGRTKEHFQCNLIWLTGPSNMDKVTAGNFNKDSAGGSGGHGAKIARALDILNGGKS
jgi:hypothetical protein